MSPSHVQNLLVDILRYSGPYAQVDVEPFSHVVVLLERAKGTVSIVLAGAHSRFACESLFFLPK